MTAYDILIVYTIKFIIIIAVFDIVACVYN